MVFVTGGYGLGENIVQGAIDPDEFYVHKPTYRAGFRAVLRRRLGGKQLRMTYGAGRGRPVTRNRPTTRAERARYCLSDQDVLTLTGQAIAIEDHYSNVAGQPTPMDIEWAKDGVDGALYIVQARPETVASRRAAETQRTTYALKGEAPALVTGRAVGEKIVTGVARVVRSARDLDAFVPGEVLVAPTTTPDWQPVMKTAAAIVTDRGGRTCHAAIVARELGVPAVVGAGDATSKLVSGMTVTVSCAEGDVGHVYAGAVPFETAMVDIGELPETRTELMLNMADPDQAFRLARVPPPESAWRGWSSSSRSTSASIRWPWPSRTGWTCPRPAPRSPAPRAATPSLPTILSNGCPRAWGPSPRPSTRAR